MRHAPSLAHHWGCDEFRPYLTRNRFRPLPFPCGTRGAWQDLQDLQDLHKRRRFGVDG